MWWTLFELCLNTVGTPSRSCLPYRRTITQMPRGKRGGCNSVTETTGFHFPPLSFPGNQAMFVLVVCQYTTEETFGQKGALDIADFINVYHCDVCLLLPSCSSDFVYSRLNLWKARAGSDNATKHVDFKNWFLVTAHVIVCINHSLIHI
jgi:hypothetical protein